MQVDNGLTLENEINHYTKVFAEMLDVMEFSLDKQIDGNYCLEDEQEGYLGGIDSYRNFTSADEIIDRLGSFLEDYYYRDLEEAACEEFGLKASELPYSAEEWVQFLEKDEYESFRAEYFHEYEVMKLISSPSEIINQINLSEV